MDGDNEYTGLVLIGNGGEDFKIMENKEQKTEDKKDTGTFKERKSKAIIDALTTFLKFKIMAVAEDFPLSMIYTIHANMAWAHAETIAAATEHTNKDSRFVSINCIKTKETL